MVVLDEATAHLELESEVAIQQALRTALAGRTSLVIVHRLSIIREADQSWSSTRAGLANAGLTMNRWRRVGSAPSSTRPNSRGVRLAPQMITVGASDRRPPASAGEPGGGRLCGRC